jgi:hypothetical protein
MRNYAMSGLLLIVVLGISPAAQAGDFHFSFGFGVGYGRHFAGYGPYVAYRPVYAYRPYVYGYSYAPYYTFRAPLYYRQYYRGPVLVRPRPYSPAPRFRIDRGRAYADYVPRRYHRYR